MTHNLLPLEHLFLLRLAVAGGGGWKKEIKPDLDPPVRQRLIDAGLIEAEKRKPESGGRSRPLYITLTDQGWAWLSAHLDAKLPPRANTTETLQLLLVRLKAYFEAKHISLAEFISPPPAHKEDPPQNGLVNGLDRRIEAAYYRLSGDQPNIRVRLADLRSALPGVPCSQLDRTLLSMESQGRAALYPLDNPLEIRPEDREAVLRTTTGDERHIVYLGGPES